MIYLNFDKGHGKSRVPFFLIIIIFYKLTFAISVNDIAPVFISSNAIRDLVKNISEKIEPFASDWSRDWRHSVPRKDVENEIFSALDLLNSRIWAEDLFSLNFLEALLWHYFYQLEIEKGYFECERITQIMKKNFPNRIESFWLNGVNKIKAGRVAEGFRILDSLYSNANVSPAFVSEYSRLSRICFIPQNYTAGNNYNFTQSTKTGEFYFSPKELKSVLSQWESVETDGVVNFIFTERFWFVENFQIKYPKLYKDEDWKIPLEIDERFLKEVKQPILWRPERAALHPVIYRITIDRGKQTLSLLEYMFSIVHNRFDYVREIKPPLKEGGISARSGEYNVIRGVSGKSVIHTIYDLRSSGNIHQFFTTRNTLRGAENFDIRVLVTLESTQRIEGKAIDFYLDIINGWYNP